MTPALTVMATSSRRSRRSGRQEGIPGHFKSINKDLYNCVKDADEIAANQAEVEEKITAEARKDVKKVTPEQLKKAAAALKPGKKTQSIGFSLIV